MEQTERNTRAITEQSEANRLLLEALHNINKNGRDTNSHQSEDDNNQWHIPEAEHRPTRPSFLPGEEQENENEVN